MTHEESISAARELSEKLLQVVEAWDPQAEKVAVSLDAMIALLVTFAMSAEVPPHIVIMRVVQACGGEFKNISVVPITGNRGQA